MVAETRPDSGFHVLGSELLSLNLARLMVVSIYENVIRPTLVPNVLMV